MYHVLLPNINFIFSILFIIIPMYWVYLKRFVPNSNFNNLEGIVSISGCYDAHETILHSHIIVISKYKSEKCKFLCSDRHAIQTVFSFVFTLTHFVRKERYHYYISAFLFCLESHIRKWGIKTFFLFVPFPRKVHEDIFHTFLFLWIIHKTFIIFPIKR